MSNNVSLIDCLVNIDDPRRRLNADCYPLINVLFIGVSAVICGADDYCMIARFGQERKSWLEKYLDLSNGVPSHDTFNRVFESIKPEQFEKALLQWITSIHQVTEGQVVAIDGKTMRRSYDRAAGKSAIHMVSAWATENCISLGQTCTDEKSNEITAIPELLEIIDIRGCLVTIDAMGCQTAIAEKILEQEADFALAVKQNQPTLHHALIEFFEDHLSDDFARIEVNRFETTERSHQREEERSYYVCAVPDGLADRERWTGLEAIGIAISNVERESKFHVETRYYILSKMLGGEQFGCAVRTHWSIENQLHWQLDVSFGEDQCRIRKNHGAANFNQLRKTALSLLKNETSVKLGIKNKRVTAALSSDYLAKVLGVK